MILTGKAKEDFIKTKIGNEINLFESMLPIYKNALIIEWFDSIKYNEIWSLWDYSFKIMYEDLRIGKSIIEIQKEAIKKANEIYNEKYSISQ